MGRFFENSCGCFGTGAGVVLEKKHHPSIHLLLRWGALGFDKIGNEIVFVMTSFWRSLECFTLPATLSTHQTSSPNARHAEETSLCNKHAMMFPFGDPEDLTTHI